MIRRPIFVDASAWIATLQGAGFSANLAAGAYAIVVRDEEKELFRGTVELPRDQEHAVRVL